MEPILSICIPTYNRKQHIERQIRYFVQEFAHIQNENDIEVIVSNNCSQDGTFEYLETINGKYKWLKIINNESNIGAYNNMKKLLHMACGKYVWIPGDDDYLKRGLIPYVLQIIENFQPSYIYLSRRSIDEETKNIMKEGKKHPIKYDVSIEVKHDELVELLKENFGDLRFQTSSIFKRTNCLKYERETDVFKKDTKESFDSLFMAVRSMQDGTAYFASEIEVLNGNQITWNDRFIDYVSVCTLDFIEGLKFFGFTEIECKKISRRQLASTYAFYLMHRNLLKEWRKKGRPGFYIDQIPCVLYLFFRKIKRLVWKSNSYTIAEVEFNDFIL